MNTPLLPDALWDLIQPLLPAAPLRPKGGRPRLPDRVCLTGILFVLRSGIPWEMLPQELRCGSGMTCWRRLRDWQEAGIWQLIHLVLLDWLARSKRIDWSRTVVDGSSIRAVLLTGHPTTELTPARTNMSFFNCLQQRNQTFQR
jgi:transposase